ncbi:hypothetical protein K1719_020767 [Acacia pycnantha]|nr:hypothetical protein K1719_020767 [Acacia pycnantha]
MVEAVHDYNNLSYSIGVLVDKSLVKIESCNRIQMHDLIRDMGRKIVREESPNNPGERSRLWFHRDIVNVLEHNTGTNKVRMIGHYIWSECIEVNWDGEAFKNYLGILNLKGCEYVIEIPDLSNLRNLREFNLWNCKNLIEIHDSIGYLQKLEILDVGVCVRLKTFPRAIKLPSLRQLSLTDCSSLKYFPAILEKTSDNLGILNIGGCEYVKEISNLSNLRNLKELSLMECKNLIGIHDSIGYLPKLQMWNVQGCVRLKTFPRAIKLPSLTMLSLERCSSVKHLREVEGIPPSIRCLEARNCVSLSLESKSIILSEVIALKMKWLSLRPCWKTPFYDESTNHQELQQQKDLTSTNVEQVPKSFEDTRKAKGKEIVIYDDIINE